MNFNIIIFVIIFIQAVAYFVIRYKFHWLYRNRENRDVAKIINRNIFKKIIMLMIL